MRKRLGDAAALAVLVAPAVLLAARLEGSGGGCAVLVNAFDVRFVNYLLEWGYRHLLGNTSAGGGIWSPPFFYPAPGVLGYSDTYFSAYPFYFAARLSGFSPQGSLLAYQLSQLALTGAVAYLCARWIGLRRLPAFLCAQCFAWGWPRYNQLAHLQFASGWVVPLFFASLYLAFRRRNPWLLAVALWTLCDTFYTAVYVAYFLVLTAGIATGLLALQDRAGVMETARSLSARVRSLRPLATVGWSAAVALPVLLLLLGAYQYRVSTRGLAHADTSEMFLYQASIWSWLRPEPGNLVWSRLAGVFPADPVAPWEKQFFLGWVAMGCCLFALVSRAAIPREGALPRAAARAAAGAVLVCILLVSHFPGRMLNWPFIAAVRFLPGFSALRASGRIGLVLSLLTALVAAVVIDELRRSRPFVAGCAAVLLLLENLAPLPPVSDRCAAEQPWKALQPRLCELGRNSGAASVLFLPMDAISFERIFAQVQEMTAALECGLASINGYSGREPPGLGPLFHGDASRFDCADARLAIDAARKASGKGVLVYLEEAGPLGPPGYPASQVTSCFSSCLSATTPVQVQERRGTVLSIAAELPCEPR